MYQAIVRMHSLLVAVEGAVRAVGLRGGIRGWLLRGGNRRILLENMYAWKYLHQTARLSVRTAHAGRIGSILLVRIPLTHLVLLHARLGRGGVVLPWLVI